MPDASDIHDLPTIVDAIASAGQTVFAFQFRAFARGYVFVLVDGVPAVFDPLGVTKLTYSISTDYSTEGGNIIFGAAMAGNESVQIYRQMPVERVSHLPLTGPVSMTEFNAEFDRHIALIQQIDDYQPLSGIKFTAQINQRTFLVPTYAALSTIVVPAAYSFLQTAGYATPGDGGGAIYVTNAADAALAALYPMMCKADASPVPRYFRLALENGGIIVEQGSAVGDNVTSNDAILNKCYLFVKAMGGGKLEFSQGKKYRITNKVEMGSDFTWNFNRAQLVCGGQVVGMWNGFDPTMPAAYVTQDVYGPTNTLTIDELGPLVIGAFYIVRLGNNPYDNNEPYWAQPVRILTKSAANGAGTITIDTIINKTCMINSAWDYAGVAVPAVGSGVPNGSNKALFLLAAGWNVTINDMIWVGDTAVNQSPESAIYGFGCYNLRVNKMICNPSGSGDIGAGAVTLQFGRNVVIDEPQIFANRNGRGQASLGRAFTFSNMENFQIIRPYVRGCQSCFCFAESFTEGIIVDPRIELSANFTAGLMVFFAGQGSSLEVRNPFITTSSNTSWNLFDSGGTVATLLVVGRVTIRGTMPISFPVINTIIDYKNSTAYSFTGTISNGSGAVGNTLSGTGNSTIPEGTYLYGPGVAPGCRITVNLGGGSYTVSGVPKLLNAIAIKGEEFAEVDFTRTKRLINFIPLRSGEYDGYTLEGPIASMQLFCSSDVVLASLSGLYCGADNNNGNNLKSQLALGSLVYDNGGRGIYGTNAQGFRKLAGRSFVLADHGTANEGYVGVIVEVGTVLASSYTGSPPPSTKLSNQVNFGSDANLEWLVFGKRLLRGKVNIAAPASIAAGAQTTLGTATVANATIKDPRPDLRLPGVSGGIDIWAEYTSANTATIYAKNGTAGALTPPAGDYHLQGSRI